MLNKQNNTYQALWVGVGSLSTFALTIVSAAILSRYFDKTEYGTYRQILYVYSTLLIIFTGGLPRVFSYFLPRYSLAQGKDIVWKISMMLFFFGFIFSIVLFLGSNFIANILNNPELAVGLKYFSPIPMLLLPTLGIEGIFTTYKKTEFIAIYNTVSRLLMLLFIVLPVIFFDGTYLYAIFGWMVASVITLIMAYFFKEIPYKNVSKETAQLDFREIFSYSLPLVAASVAGLAIRSADQFYISRYFGPEIFAEYSNGFIQIPFVGMVTGATSMVLMPQFSKMIHEKTEINKIAVLWKNALAKSALLIYPMVIFFMFHAKPIIILLYSEDYSGSVIYFQIAMTVNFFNIIIFAPLLFSFGETKFYLKVQIAGAILAWVVGFFLIKTYSKPENFAILTVLITVFLVLTNLKKVADLLKIRFWDILPLNSFLMISTQALLVCAAITIGYIYLWGSLNYFLILVINFSLFGILMLGSGKFFKLDYFSVLKPLLSKKNDQ